MKENVLILSKTQMNNNKVCVGGLTFSGKFVRLLDSYGNNLPEDTRFAPRQVWEIDYIPKADIVPPHNEDVFIENLEKKGKLKDEITVKQFIEKRKVKIWSALSEIKTVTHHQLLNHTNPIVVTNI